MTLTEYRVDHNLIYYHRSEEMIVATTVRPKKESITDHNYALHTAVPDSAEWNAIVENREELKESVDFSHLVTLKQVHGKTIHAVDGNTLSEYELNPLIEGDGLYTRQKDILIGVLTADCIPLFFIADDIIGVAHAGWRGVYDRIHTEMIELWKSREDVRLSDVRVIIGPHIKGCCYEVSEDLFTRFKERFDGMKIGRQQHEKFYLDLENIIIEDLIRSGMDTDHISSAGLCSMCSDRNMDIGFYSYRRGDDTGRMLSFIGMRP